MDFTLDTLGFTDMMNYIDHRNDAVLEVMLSSRLYEGTFMKYIGKLFILNS